MTAKAFSILLVTVLVLGVALGGAFTGGYALGKNADPVETPLSQSLRPSSGFQAGGQARAGQRQGEPEAGSAQTGADRGADSQSASSADRSDRRGAADGSEEAGEAPANERQESGGNQTLFGIISSLEDNLVTLDSPRGQAQATISETTVIQKTVMGSVGDLSVGATVQVAGRPDADGQVQARSLTISPASDGDASGLPDEAGQSIGGRGAPLVGPIESVEGGLVTVAGADGPMGVSMSPNTQVWKLESGAQADLVEGARVRITGLAAADGQVRADVVTLIPEGSGPGARPRP